MYGIHTFSMKNLLNELQGYDHWVPLNTFVEEAMPRWRVKDWCTTLEQCPEQSCPLETRG